MRILSRFGVGYASEMSELFIKKTHSNFSAYSGDFLERQLVSKEIS
jgi:hypothetical protein